MEYISTPEAAEKWGVTPRQVQRLLAAGRITGAKKYGRDWLIPAYTQKPGDPRSKSKASPQYSLSSELAELVAVSTLPMPFDNPGAILNTVKEERLRLQYEGEIAYLRGDFEHTIRCFRKTEGDDVARLRACSVAIAAAISTGDYPFYLEIETYLKGFIKNDPEDELSIFAELCLSSAYTGAAAPNLVPGWLQRGDFTLLYDRMKPDAAYKRAKYFQCLGRFESMLAVADTALEFCACKSGITFHGIYFRIICAAACCALNRLDEAKRWLLDVMKITLPYGFITPFAESATSFGGLLEQCLEREFPGYYDAILGQWKRTFTKWLTFHNRFTKDNITLILSLRDYQIALLAAHGMPLKKIAEQFYISTGTLNNRMRIIYDTLAISGKNELAKYIL